MKSADYEKAKKLGLTEKDRWREGLKHHPMSVRLMEFLLEHECEMRKKYHQDYDSGFCWKMGGDGDNGETLMYQMDAFFEMLDAEPKRSLSWECGCGHVNGSNLDTCSVCGRRPGEKA